jgi:hypothetical protein
MRGRIARRDIRNYMAPQSIEYAQPGGRRYYVTFLFNTTGFNVLNSLAPESVGLPIF